jgi:hypothetical protein
MYFKIQSIYRPAAILGEPNLFINNHQIDVVVFSPDEDMTETLAARIVVDHIDTMRVQEAGESLLDVCDSGSADWEALYSIIFDLSSEPPRLRDDFYNCETELLRNLVFIYKAVFHPKVRNLQCYILDHVAQLFCNESAILMWEGNTDLTRSELGSLGFRSIAGEGLLLRPNPLKTRYESKTDDERADSFELNNDRYVEQNWNADE